MSLKSRHWIWVVFFLLLGAFPRFYWLGFPNQVVFDEVTFGRQINAYCCTGKSFLFLHPPLPKVIMAKLSQVFGYEGNQKFQKIGEPYNKDVPLFALRFWPAVTGSLVPALVFLLLLLLGGSTAGAVFGGLIIGLDNAQIVQSKFISFDTMLVSFVLLSLVCLLHSLNQKERKGAWVYLTLSGFAAGMAVSAKITGLSVWGLCLVLLWMAWKKHSESFKVFLAKCGVFTLSGLMVYGFGWILHFSMITEPTTRDRDFVASQGWVRDIARTNTKMYRINRDLKAKHNYASSPWGWPLMQKPIYYWRSKTQHIYFMGNPVVWWGSTLLFLMALSWWSINRFVTRKKHQSAFSYRWFSVLGFFANFIPYLLIARVLFLYHYTIALIFSLVAGCLWLEDRGFFKAKSSIWKQRPAYYALIGLVFVGFISVLPITLGWELGQHEAFFLFRWFPSWK